MDMVETNDIQITMMTIIKTAKQPTGNTCGPTCLFMAYNALFGEKLSILEIADLCTTDWLVGTPPDKMILGMNSIGLTYIHHQAPEKPYTLLTEILDKQNIPIVRTITNGIPHWIIVSNHTNKGSWHIKCPSIGDFIYTTEQLDNVWKQRNYELFEIENENRKRY